MNTLTTIAPLTIAADFRITRAFEADCAEYGDQTTAAADLILSSYDRLAELVASGRTDEARQIAELFTE